MTFYMWFHNRYRRNKCTLSYQKHVRLSHYDVLCDFICLRICYAILFYVHVLFVVITIRSFLLSWLIIGFVTRVTGRVLHGEQELPTLPEDMSSSPGFSGVSVRSLFVPLFFFLWLWNYLSFFDLRFFIIPLGF